MPTIPNRTEDLARPRSRNGKARDRGEVSTRSLGNVTIPEPGEAWGSHALMLWNAALDGGVSEFYASTDWATLWLMCDSVQHWTDQGGRRSPELLRVIMQGLGSLMFTEGDRRKLRVELEKPEDLPTWETELALLVTEMDETA
jgi:hypothetical protein